MYELKTGTVSVFFVDYRQKNWPEQLVIVEFLVNNKTHLVTKVCLFIANYDRELKIEADIRRKQSLQKFQKKVGVVLIKI